MRLTINLDDDLYAMARSHAIATRTSISKAVGDLLRNRGQSNHSKSLPAFGLRFHVDPETGLPVVPGKSATITDDDVRRALDDELVRPMELMGLSDEEIAEKLS